AQRRLKEDVHFFAPYPPPQIISCSASITYSLRFKEDAAKVLAEKKVSIHFENRSSFGETADFLNEECELARDRFGRITMKILIEMREVILDCREASDLNDIRDSSRDRTLATQYSGATYCDNFRSCIILFILTIVTLYCAFSIIYQ
ncbi:hypothetical protein PFISCL1PPCAC_22244, partial [Pristionchus fissidentatus]